MIVGYINVIELTSLGVPQWPSAYVCRHVGCDVPKHFFSSIGFIVPCSPVEHYSTGSAWF